MVAVRHFLSNTLVKRFCQRSVLYAALLVSVSSLAQNSNTEPTPFKINESVAQGYLARIGYNDPDQLNEALGRVQAFYEEHGSDAAVSPISLVVHGPEVEIFDRTNYQMFKSIVDRAAQLTALGVLDIAVCETRINDEGLSVGEVYPFVDTVPYGPAEVDRLLSDEGYIYF